MRNCVFFSKKDDGSVQLVQTLLESPWAEHFVYVCVDPAETQFSAIRLLLDVLEVEYVPTLVYQGEKYVGRGHCLGWLEASIDQNQNQNQNQNENATLQNPQPPDVTTPIKARETSTKLGEGNALSLLQERQRQRSTEVPQPPKTKNTDSADSAEATAPMFEPI